jgi:hypothetical protein
VRTIASEKELSDWLLEVGDGRSDANIGLSPPCFSYTQKPVEHISGDINFTFITEQLKERAVQGVINEDPLKLKNKVLDYISGEETVYKSVDTVASQESSYHLAYTIEFLSSLIPIGMRPHELKVKVSTVILLHPNLMPSRGLYIGKRLTITRLKRHSDCVLYEVACI